MREGGHAVGGAAMGASASRAQKRPFPAFAPANAQRDAVFLLSLRSQCAHWLWQSARRRHLTDIEILPCRGENCGFALPVAEQAKTQLPQRSKNRRIREARTVFRAPQGVYGLPRRCAPRNDTGGGCACSPRRIRMTQISARRRFAPPLRRERFVLHGKKDKT